VNRFRFRSDDTTERVPVDMEHGVRRKVSSSLLLYFTGITRRADDILGRQKSNMDAGDKRSAMCAMVDLVNPFSEAMKTGDVETCGRLLDRNWRLKQQMASGISNDEIAAMHRTAVEAGALAGKVCGAGGGGFLLLVVPRENQNRVFAAMQAYRELPFMIEECGSKVIFDDRSYSSK
jgi:D-glycero-alpha-D-manno-heptose-7-phosphate kinase